MIRQDIIRILGCLALLGLTACAMTEGPPPVLGLGIEGKSCAEQPMLTGAQELVLATNKPITVIVDTNTPCLESSNGLRSAYAVFMLPSSSGEYLVSVTSVPQGQTLFSPRVMMLDATGGVLREVPNDIFTFRGSSLAVSLRVRPSERYLLVASDPSTVGQEVSRIQSATMSTVVSAGYVYVPINTGSEAEVSYIYAHNGSITVAATPVPKTN
jgi:hypothetical protein